MNYLVTATFGCKNRNNLMINYRLLQAFTTETLRIHDTNDLRFVCPFSDDLDVLVFNTLPQGSVPIDYFFSELVDDRRKELGLNSGDSIPTDKLEVKGGDLLKLGIDLSQY